MTNVELLNQKMNRSIKEEIILAQKKITAKREELTESYKRTRSTRESRHMLEVMERNFESCVLEQGKGHEAILKSLLLDQRELQYVLSDLFLTLGPDTSSSLEVVADGDDTLVAEDEEQEQQKDGMIISMVESQMQLLSRLL